MKLFDLKPNDIKDLKLKLNGKLPIDRDELLALVNSWGRDDWCLTSNKDGYDIKIETCEAKEKYDLSKLDVSLIKDFNKIFYCSNFNGDINSWNVSNATSMAYMFAYTKYFNQPLDKWNTSNVIFAYDMFTYTENFNQNLNSWDISNMIDIEYIFSNAEAFNQPVLWNMSKVESCYGIFDFANAFEKRFNNGKYLPSEKLKIKKWLKDNKILMEAIHVENNKSKELDNFLLNINNKNVNIVN